MVEIIVAILTLAGTYFGGAISEKESNGEVTRMISYDTDTNTTLECKQVKLIKQEM